MSVLNKLIENSADFCSLGAVDLSEIAENEKQLGVCFSDDYKDYVFKFGAATFDGHELTGVCKSDRLSVVKATERAREFFLHFPADLYVVEELLFDHIIIVQNSNGKVCSYGPSDGAKCIADSLQDYLFPKTTAK